MREFRIPASTIAGFSLGERPWRSTEEAQIAYLNCPLNQKAEFLNSLTAGQRAVITIGILRGEVDNGGFRQFFWNSSCTAVHEAIEGLRLIAAVKHADLVEDAAKKTKLSGPDYLDVNKRQHALTALGREDCFDPFDQRFYDLNSSVETDLDVLIQNYYEAHKAEFHISEEWYAQLLKDEIARKLSADFRTEKPKQKLHADAFRWMLIEKLWDDYWEELKAGKTRLEQFVAHLSRGQRAAAAVEILFRNIMIGRGILGLSELGFAIAIFGEIEQAFSVLGAEPYRAIWADWQGQSAELTRYAGECDKLGSEYRAIRNSRGKEAAADLSSKFMSANKAVREKKEELESEAEKMDLRLKDLFSKTDTAIESFLRAYAERMPSDFFV